MKSKKVEICSRCGKKVYYAERKAALDKFWHEYCFTCVTCKRILSTHNFASHQGEIYCKPCYIRGSVYGFDTVKNDLVRCRSGGTPKPEESFEKVQETSNVRPSDIKNAMQKRRQHLKPQSSDESLSNHSEFIICQPRHKKHVRCPENCPSIKKTHKKGKNQGQGDGTEDRPGFFRKISLKKLRNVSETSLQLKATKHAAKSPKTSPRIRPWSQDSAYDTENNKNTFQKLCDKLLPFKCPNCECEQEPIPINQSNNSFKGRFHPFSKKINRQDANASDNLKKKHRQNKLQQKEEILFTSESGTVKIVKITKPKCDKHDESFGQNDSYRLNSYDSVLQTKPSPKRFNKTAVKVDKNIQISNASLHSAAVQATNNLLTKHDETFYKTSDDVIGCSLDTCKLRTQKKTSKELHSPKLNTCSKRPDLEDETFNTTCNDVTCEARTQNKQSKELVHYKTHIPKRNIHKRPNSEDSLHLSDQESISDEIDCTILDRELPKTKQTRHDEENTKQDHKNARRLKPSNEKHGRRNSEDSVHISEQESLLYDDIGNKISDRQLPKTKHAKHDEENTKQDHKKGRTRHTKPANEKHDRRNSEDSVHISEQEISDRQLPKTKHAKHDEEHTKQDHKKSGRRHSKPPNEEHEDRRHSNKKSTKHEAANNNHMDNKRDKNKPGGRTRKKTKSDTSLQDDPLPEQPARSSERKTRSLSPKNILNRFMFKTKPDNNDRTIKSPVSSDETIAKALKDNNNNHKKRILEETKRSVAKKQTKPNDSKKTKQNHNDFAPQKTSTPAKKPQERKRSKKVDEFTSADIFNTPVTHPRPKPDQFAGKNVKSPDTSKQKKMKASLDATKNERTQQHGDIIPSAHGTLKNLPKNITKSPKKPNKTLETQNSDDTYHSFDSDPKETTKKHPIKNTPLKFPHLHTEEDFFESAVRRSFDETNDTTSKMSSNDETPLKHKKKPARMSSGGWTVNTDKKCVVTAEISPKKNIIRDYSSLEHRIVKKPLNGILKSGAVQQIIERYSPRSENDDRLCNSVRKEKCVFGYESRHKSTETSKVVHPSTTQILYTPVVSLPETPTDGTSGYGGSLNRSDRYFSRYLKNEYQEVPKDFCNRCGEQVFLPEKKMAAEGVFHQWCFTCFICKRNLDSLNLLTRKNEIYCQKCYMKFFGPQLYGYGLCPNLCDG